jgi:hypothetical protein
MIGADASCSAIVVVAVIDYPTTITTTTTNGLGIFEVLH